MKRNSYWFLLLSGLSGCAMGPDYQEETPAVPVHWQAEQQVTKPGQSFAKAIYRSGSTENLVEKFRRCRTGQSDG